MLTCSRCFPGFLRRFLFGAKAVDIGNTSTKDAGATNSFSTRVVGVKDAGTKGAGTGNTSTISAGIGDAKIGDV